MTQQSNGDSMGKGGGSPLGQRQAVAGTSGTGAGGIWRGMEGQRRVGEGAEDDCPIPDPNKAESIFVPFLPQIGTFSTEKEERKEKAEKRRRRGFEQQMEGGGCRISRRTFGLALVLSLVLISGAFALFDSLLDDSEEERPNGENEDKSMSDEDVKNYLNRFGYIEGAPMEADQPPASAGVFAQQKHRTADELLGDFSLDSLKSAIQRFQEFAGLPKTGELDNRTRKKMKQPRCGMQDVEMMSRTEGGGGMKWRKRQLTYRIDHFTADLPHYMQKKALQMAFDAWSKQIPLDFSETTGHQQADIRVRFARGSHGDPWPFDGKGGVLAHATFPSDGQLHFDDDEQWAFMDASKISSFRYTDLFWVSLHEIGHVLGLSHSKVETAIMAPFYRDPDEMVDWRGNYKTPELTYDDIQAAQQIYGTRRNGNGGGNRRGGGRDEGHYDDKEGGFLSQLGKLFGGEEEDEGQGGGQRSRNGGNDGREGNGRRSYSRGGGHRGNRAEEEEEEDGIFGKYFSSAARSSNANFPILALFAILPLILSFFS